MSDDRPLEDLSEQLREVSNLDQASQPTVESDVPSPEPERIDADEPAFPHAATQQGPIAPRGETWERYDEAIADIKTVLRDHGVENPAGREFDDAILRLAADNPEAIAKLILDARVESRAGEG